MFHALMSEWCRARQHTDDLFARVPESLMYARPIAERHRIAFYLGHLEAFDRNLLLRGAHSPLDRLFAFGIDPVDGGLPSDAVEDWPPLQKIRAYAAHARERLNNELDEEAIVGGVPVQTLLQVAIEHRLMHAETLAYMLNRLPMDKPLRDVVTTQRAPGAEDLVRIPAGHATLGLPRASAQFGWDNEYDAHAVQVPAFEIDRHMVTNAQFLRFIEARGYAQPQWWSQDDWRWLSAQSITHPAAWQRDGKEWRLLSFNDRVPFQDDWPVYVSHAEASAYALWRGVQLPTEAQWQRAAYGEPNGGERLYPWGEQEPQAQHGNFDFAGWDPMPVDAHPAGASAFGVRGLIGNGWEWTCTPFAPYAGFQASSFYPGYSADFFDGKHYVLKGGSAHTAARLLRRSFRNWFQPRYPYPHAGFRCVRNA